MQLVADLGDRGVDQPVGVGGLHPVAQDVAGGGDRHGDGLVLDLADGALLGGGDLLGRGLEAPRDRVADVLLGGLGGLLGLGAGGGDDVLGLGLDLLLPPLVAGEERYRKDTTTWRDIRRAARSARSRMIR